MHAYRCPRALHFVTIGAVIERKCPDCSRDESKRTGTKVTIFHRWLHDAESGIYVTLDDREERDDP